MNEKIAIAQFAAAVAKATGYKADFCEQFIHEMFRTVTEGLKEDKIVKIKSLGTFIVSEDGSVKFSPDQTLADTVNEPFAFFQPEELDDDVTEEILEQGITPMPVAPAAEAEVEEPAEPKAEAEIEKTPAELAAEAEAKEVLAEPEQDEEDTPAQPKQEDSEEENEDDEDESTEATEDSEASENVANIATTEIEETPEQAAKTDYDDTNSAVSEEAEPVHKGYRLWAIVAAFIAGLLIGGGVSYYLCTSANHSDTPIAEATTTEATVEPEETAEDAEPTELTESKASEATDVVETEKAEPAAKAEPAEVVTETVTAGNFLTKMARRHYGRYEFWVYIYQENSDILDNPDRIEPNTVVVIPPAEKYGIDKNDKASLDRANKLAGEIYGRFR